MLEVRGSRQDVNGHNHERGLCGTTDVDGCDGSGSRLSQSHSFRVAISPESRDHLGSPGSAKIRLILTHPCSHSPTRKRSKRSSQETFRDLRLFRGSSPAWRLGVRPSFVQLLAMITNRPMAKAIARTRLRIFTQLYGRSPETRPVTPLISTRYVLSLY